MQWKNVNPSREWNFKYFHFSYLSWNSRVKKSAMMMYLEQEVVNISETICYAGSMHLFYTIVFKELFINSLIGFFYKRTILFCWIISTFCYVLLRTQIRHSLNWKFYWFVLWCIEIVFILVMTRYGYGWTFNHNLHETLHR